jgi:superfamily II DNA or RNA helicase
MPKTSDSKQAPTDGVERELTELERRAKLVEPRAAPAQAPEAAAASTLLSPEEKVSLFRDLFRGREDVYAERFVAKKTGKAGYGPVCANKFVKGICELPKVKCGACANRALRPMDDRAVDGHLRGDHVLGIYPLLEDETCWLLAMDFDKSTWMDDARAVRETCARLGIPAYVERSRSGEGAHVWFFFAAPVAASLARKLGAHVLTETMSGHPGLSFDSYDRLFPNQDTMPAGGFGNLIALPLQHEARQQGNSVFVGADWKPVRSQWSLLQRIERIEVHRVEALVKHASRAGTILGVRTIVEDDDGEDEAPWLRSPSGAMPTPAVRGPLPETLYATLSQRLFVDKKSLPPALIAQIRRIAAFQNPEFYKKQAMHVSTWSTPRIICCAENLDHHVALPRGCAGDLEALARRYHMALALEDIRSDGEPLDLSFTGELTALQAQAVESLLAHETGVLVAPPGVGKTVVATALIAKRKRSTLILVHRRHLLDQWRAQLALFLGIEPTAVGQIGGGGAKAKKPNGLLDIAMVQALVKPDTVDDAVAGYGQVIIDECHHASSVSFERVLAEVRARFVVGLTATPQRRDGQQAIMRMYLGPIRFQVTPKKLAAIQPLEHRLFVRETSFELEESEADLSITEIYGRLHRDDVRNTAILEDIIGTLVEGRNPIVLTQRREHLEWFAERVRPYARNVAVLKGGMGKQAEQEARETLAAATPDGSTVLVATGPYVGEGFDDPRLDTLFLAMPIAWKGTLAQYVGRLHRLHPGKQEVRVFDYVDRAVPTLRRMFEKRLRGYRAIGYAESEVPEGFELLSEQWPADWDGIEEE